MAAEYVDLVLVERGCVVPSWLGSADLALSVFWFSKDLLVRRLDPLVVRLKKLILTELYTRFKDKGVVEAQGACVETTKDEHLVVCDCACCMIGSGQRYIT
jgi:hypothetical protein